MRKPGLRVHLLYDNLAMPGVIDGHPSTRDTLSRKTGGDKVSKLPHRHWGNEVTLTRRGHFITNLDYDPP
jgi:hypothetical protein